VFDHILHMADAIGGHCQTTSGQIPKRLNEFFQSADFPSGE
jgi:hypothetical protein